MLTVPIESDDMFLYTHPDGARLAVAPYAGGISPGLYLEMGDYAIQVLLLAPHGECCFHFQLLSLPRIMERTYHTHATPRHATLLYCINSRSLRRGGVYITVYGGYILAS